MALTALSTCDHVLAQGSVASLVTDMHSNLLCSCIPAVLGSRCKVFRGFWVWGIVQCELQIMLTGGSLLGWMLWDEGVSMMSVEEDGDAVSWTEHRGLG